MFYNLNYGVACGASADELFTCLSALDCADFATMEGCEEHVLEVEELCK